MKVEIRDKEVFERLNPFDLAGYLRANHWNEVRNRPDHSSDWQKDYQGETAELLLPLNRTYRDFGQRMVDAVKLVAAMEGRSELAVIDDIQTAGMDIIRIQLDLAEAADGTVALARGTALYHTIPELFFAAACAAQQPRVYYTSKMSMQVSNFVKHLRFGQTEYGSYVVRVLSPVPPALHGLFRPTEEPFARQAIQALVRGLEALRKAADLAFASGAGKSFEQAVAFGVSANLCAAVAKIAGPMPNPTDNLVFRLTAARNRPLAIPFPEVISFPGQCIPFIREAARFLKKIALQEEQRIHGYVIKLQTTEEKDSPAGPVTIATVIDGRRRKVTITLTEAERDKAIQAYHQGLEIVCRGILTRTEQSWSLQEPSKVTILANK